MKRSNNPAGTNPGYTRRKALGLLGGGAALLGGGAASRSAFAQGSDDVLTEALVLRDPDVPAAGNPDGDINIVGKFRVPGILTMAEFEMVIADARKARKTN